MPRPESDLRSRRGFRRRGVGLVDLSALVLRGALHEKLLGLDTAIAVWADRDDRDRVLEIPRLNSPVRDRHAAAGGVDEHEGKLLFSRVEAVALLLESAHHLDRAERLAGLLERE